MQTIKTYLYPNMIEVQIIDTSIFVGRNRQVYSRPIKVYQGIDNPMQVTVMNQDQKKIDMSTYALQADIQDPTNKRTIVSFGISWINRAKGLGTFTIDKETINALEQRFYKLAFKTISVANNAEAPAYVDDNYGVPLDLEVLPAYYSTTEDVPADHSVLDSGVFDNNIAGTTPDEIVFDGGTL